MANNFITKDIIAKEALVVAEENIVFGKSINRGYTEEFMGVNVGDSIRIKKAAELTALEYDGVSDITNYQDITESSVTLKMEKHFYIPVKISSKELNLSVDDFTRDVVKGAIKGIAKSVEQYSLSQIKKVPYFAENISGVPASGKDLAELEAQTIDQKFPMNDPKWYIMNSRTKAALITADSGKMYDASVRSDDGTAFSSANFGTILGLSGIVSTQLPTKLASTATTGSTIVSPVLSSKNETVIFLDDLGVGETITEGDILVITNSDGSKVQASVKTGVSSATGTNDSLTVFALEGNIEAGADVVVKNVGYGCVYHSKAFVLSTVPLDAAMGGANSAYAYDQDLAMGIRVTTNFVGLNNVIIFDVLAGSDLVNPHLAFRTDLV